MPSTLALLEKALKMQRAAAWAREFNLTEATFTNAKKRGRLSPTLAGAIAQRLNEDPQRWIAIAAIEAEPPTALKESLIKRIAKLYFSTLQRARRRVK